MLLNFFSKKGFELPMKMLLSWYSFNVFFFRHFDTPTNCNEFDVAEKIKRHCKYINNFMRLQVGKIFCNFLKITFYPKTVYSISFDNTELCLLLIVTWLESYNYFRFIEASFFFLMSITSHWTILLPVYPMEYLLW